MTLPVLNAAFKVLDGRVVLCPSLCLIDLISDALCGGETEFEFIDVWIGGILDSFDQRLSKGACEYVGRK